MVFLKSNLFNISTLARGFSSVRSIEETFIDPAVQRILSTITSASIFKKSDEVFAPQRIKRNRSELVMMTEKEYAQKLKAAIEKAQRNMQPFPVKMPYIEHPPPGTMLQSDKDLCDFSQHRHVFVDLTPEVPGRHNLVTIRETSGDLRTATPEEGAIFRNIFFPQRQPGRLIKTPSLLGKEMNKLLEDGKYSYILKRACVQFDPDTSAFVQITSKVFDHLTANRSFAKLDATPYFANLIFYCVSPFIGAKLVDAADAQKLTNLLVYFISSDRPDDVTRVVELCKILNPQVFSDLPKTFDPNEAAKNIASLKDVFSALKNVFSEEQVAELHLALQVSLDKVNSEQTVDDSL